MLIVTISSQCFAMTFYHPKRIGLVCFGNLKNGIEILNETEVKNIPEPNTVGFRPNLPYGSGIKQFNNGEDALYVHYDTKNYKYLFGGKNISNTLNIQVPQAVIYRIATDSKITLYCIESDYDLFEDHHYTIIGRRQDGRFVKYFDTMGLVKNYFGSRQGFSFEKINFVNNQITIYYKLFYNGNYRNATGQGQFKFTWDDKAQWFANRTGGVLIMKVLFLMIALIATLILPNATFANDRFIIKNLSSSTNVVAITLALINT